VRPTFDLITIAFAIIAISEQSSFENFVNVCIFLIQQLEVKFYDETKKYLVFNLLTFVKIRRNSNAITTKVKYSMISSRIVYLYWTFLSSL